MFPVPMRVSHLASLPGLRRTGHIAFAALAVGLVVAAPATADNHTPEYSLSIVEGANTQPEDPILHVSAGASSKAEVVLSIAHGGLVVDQDKGNGGAWLSHVPQVGDLVTLESPAGTVRGAVVYDGLPSLDPTVCAGSANFSGQRSQNETVEGGYYTVGPRTSYFARHGGGLAQVQVLSGSVFQGGFLTPLTSGETVFASESLISPIAGGTFAYSSENDRPVGACPLPPPPPPPPPPLALSGSLVKFVRISIHSLLRMVGQGEDQPARKDRPRPVLARRLYPRVCGKREQAPSSQAAGSAAGTRDRHGKSGRHGQGHDASNLSRPSPAQKCKQRQSHSCHDVDSALGCKTHARAPLRHAAPVGLRASSSQPARPADARSQGLGERRRPNRIGVALDRSMAATAGGSAAAVAHRGRRAAAALRGRASVRGDPNSYRSLARAGANSRAALRARSRRGACARGLRRSIDVEPRRRCASADNEQGSVAGRERGAHPRQLARDRAAHTT